MAQQTAVEWLYERLERMIPRREIYRQDKIQYLEQAKQMEKEQVIEAYIEASPRLEDIIKEAGEQYYKETYENK